jgi:hypothetical protein
MDVNGSRYDPGSADGLYESYYLRANHPDRPLAFWIRYTVFSPAGRPGEARGELWAIVFDRIAGHVSEKLEFPIADCSFDRDRLAVRLGPASLDATELRGRTGSIGWDLSYGGGQAPLLLLPPSLYRGGFPKAKSLVPQPLARFMGELRVADRTIDVDGWRGSQNHNWGSRHTDRYAFGQVAGFDNAPESFLEVATARLRFGPLWMPALTPLVLRHRGREYAVNAISTAVRAQASISPTRWSFATRQGPVTISGVISADPTAFVNLRYANPPGGFKHCHNTKLAACTLTIADVSTGSTDTLVSEHAALFELLDDDPAAQPTYLAS